MADVINTELPLSALRGALFGSGHDASIGNQDIEAVMGGGKFVAKPANRFHIR